MGATPNMFLIFTDETFTLFLPSHPSVSKLVDMIKNETLIDEILDKQDLDEF